MLCLLGLDRLCLAFRDLFNLRIREYCFHFDSHSHTFKPIYFIIRRINAPKMVSASNSSLGTPKLKAAPQMTIIIIKQADTKMQRQQKQRPLPSCFRIQTSLIHKYSNKFHFYFSKSINELIYNPSRSAVNAAVKDVLAFADDTEYLNRIYCYFNAYGKEEIYDRIRLIGSFYADRPFMFQYPMVVITGTIKIFKTRERRLRKMVASDGSSDESEVDNGNKESFPSQGFLESMSSVASQSSLASMFQSVNHKLSFESQTYNIYEDNVKMFEISSQKKILDLEESSVDYLVCDFKDFDIEGTLANYDRILEMKKNAENCLTLTSIAAMKPVYQSIIINENKSEEARLNNKYSRLLANRDLEYKTSRLSKQSKNNPRLDDGIKQKRITSGDKVYRNAYEGREARKAGPRIQDIEDRDWRRRKIRDKATELLIRVKSQNYLNGRTDYLQY